MKVTDSREVASILTTNPLLHGLEPQTLEAILPEIEERELTEGEVLIQQDGQTDGYYIVKSGSVEIIADNITIDRLTVGQGFGEISLFSGYFHGATVRGTTPASLVRISRNGFLQLLDIQPHLAEYVYHALETRIRQYMLGHALRRMLGDIEDALIDEIAPELTWETYIPGDIIFRQGEPGSDLLVIVTGRVAASLHDGESERVLGEVGTGSFVGELALLSDAPRSATIKAIRETTLVRLNRILFDKIVRLYPTFARRLITVIVERQHRNFNQHHVEKPTTLNLTLAATQPGVDLLGFAKTLLPYLQKHGSAIVVNRSRFDELYRVHDAASYMRTSQASLLVRQWMTEIEQNHDYVLFVADQEWTAWSSMVVHNADRVLLIGEANGSPLPGEMERTSVSQVDRQRYELVILHEPDTQQPSGTANWLNARQVEQHHHIRKDDGAHFARLARLLTGNGIGLVLGGGGARGYAHIGVIKALMEAQVPIDAIGAASIGAVVGAGLLRFMNLEDIQNRTAEFGSRKRLLDLTFPISALMRSKKVSDAMENIYSDFMIEDGWLPFFCVSTNLTKAQINVHQRGKLHEAVRASISIPGVFSPVVRNGDLVVDGGVMNNFPVDIMRQILQGGTIIGTTVYSSGASRGYEIPDYINGWQTFISCLVPGIKRKRIPSIIKTILGASSVNSHQRLEELGRRTDFLIQTDTAPYGILDFDNHAELTQMAYDTHIEKIHAWANEHAQLIEQPPLWQPLN